MFKPENIVMKLKNKFQKSLIQGIWFSDPLRKTKQLVNK